MAKRKVVLFEDIKKHRDDFCKHLNKSFSKSADIVPFEPSAIKGKGTYEDKIIKEFEKRKIKIEDIALIITDRDLSQYREVINDDNSVQWSGLSESVVSNFADIFAIPICLYAREDKTYGSKLSNAKQWSDYKIVLEIEEGHKPIADKCKAIFDGFEDIRKGYKKAMAKKPTSPAQLISSILGRPELQDRISLYGAGDQHIIEDILPYVDNKRKIEARIPRLLGYWLWDSILRYPGLLVFKDAAASYLNIDPADFKKKSIKSEFKGAEYKGPFSQVMQFWWRDKLDSIIYSNDCSDGFEYITKKKKKKINACKCFVDKELKAGYYCMVHNKPVSKEKSKSNISWFPPGADLARIATKDFNKLSPWIGLY